MKTIEKEKAVPGLKSEMIGNIINPDLKEAFRKYLTGDDKALISQETRVGFHTVDKLLAGANTLTENNCKAVSYAVEFTANKIGEEIEEAKTTRRRLLSKLSK